MRKKYYLLIVFMSLFCGEAIAQSVTDTTFYDKTNKHIGTIVTTENNIQLQREYSEEGLLTSYTTLTTQKKKKGGHSFRKTEVLLDAMGCVRYELNQSPDTPWGIIK